MPSRLAQNLGKTLILAAVYFAASPGLSPGKDFLTNQEIEKIQDAQEIDLRVKVYLDAAALRLQAAEARLNGKESEAGDPMEFFTPEDMLDAYNQIIRSVMINLDDAFQKPSVSRDRVVKALKNLKDSMEKSTGRLAVLKKMAEEKEKEYLWTLVNRAAEITDGAREGAELGLSRENPPDQNPPGEKMPHLEK